MTPPKSPITPRTLITGAAMLGAAFVAFSLNQGGLTGRATGGAVGCGGGEPAVGRSASGLDPLDLERDDGTEFEVPSERPTYEVSTGFELSEDGQIVFGVGSPPETGLVPRAPSHERVLPMFEEASQPPTPDVAETLWQRLERDGHRGFLELVDRADLVSIFQDGDAEYTVFVPTGESLEDIPSALMEEGNEALLQAFIFHHMVPGRFEVSDLPNGSMPTALEFQPVRQNGAIVTGTRGTEAEIVSPDSPTYRGMVHTVEGILLPKFTLQVMLLNGGYDLFYAMVESSGHMDVIADPHRVMTALAIPDEIISAIDIEIDEIEDGMNGTIRSIVENHLVEGPLDPAIDDAWKTYSGLDVQHGDDVLRFSTGDTMSIEADGHAENGPLYRVDNVVADLAVN